MPESESRRLAPAAPKTPSNNQKRRKNVGTACLACKARKLKCTGAPPCANCLKSRLECTLDETADKRRRGALKRKIDELEDKEDLLMRLVEVLRESSDRRTAPLLNLIRSNASFSEIRFYIEHQLPRSELLQAPELADAYHQLKQRHLSDPQSKRRVLSAKRLSDIPHFSVPARPWTAVVADDDLVSHLVSLWFTWVHPFCNWIDRDLFLGDMKARSLSGAYCSPFLVNIILADACAYSDYTEVYGITSDLTSRAVQFYDEAKRLLDKEEGRITLPTVQGLGVLWMCASTTGRDPQGWIRRGQLAYSLQEVSQLFPQPSSKADSKGAHMAQLVNRTHWGLFNLAMVHTLFDRKAPVVKLPQISSFRLWPAALECDMSQWHPYPDQSTGVEAHATCLFNALCSLNQTTYVSSSFIFVRNESHRHSLEIVNETVNALRALSEWFSHLPKCLQEININVPHVLSLHMYYHTVMMTIYGALKAQPTFTTTYHSGTPTTYEPILSPMHAHEMCCSSARNIAQLTRIHHSTWGFDRMLGMHLNWIMAAIFTLLEALDGPGNRDAFISLTIAAKALSRRWESTRTLFQSIQTTAQQRGILLPAEIDLFFVDADQRSTCALVKSETPDATTTM